MSQIDTIHADLETIKTTLAKIAIESKSQNDKIAALEAKIESAELPQWLLDDVASIKSSATTIDALVADPIPVPASEPTQEFVPVTE